MVGLREGGGVEESECWMMHGCRGRNFRSLSLDAATPGISHTRGSFTVCNHVARLGKRWALRARSRSHTKRETATPDQAHHANGNV